MSLYLNCYLNSKYHCSLSGRTGGYPDDDLIKFKKNQKNSQDLSGPETYFLCMHGANFLCKEYNSKLYLKDISFHVDN